jgi:hypothetical protein
MYSVLTYVGKILGDFSGSRKPVRIFYVEINGNFIFDLLIFNLRTIFIEQIMFVNRGMGVQVNRILLIYNFSQTLQTL